MEMRDFWLRILLAQVSLEAAEAVLAAALPIEAWSQAALETLGVRSVEAGRLAAVETARVEAHAAWLAQPNHWLMHWADEDYPLLLRQIDNPPPVLLGMGQRSLLNDPQAAIVGARHASKEGLRNAEDFAQALSQAGVTVTSGLAHGIDGAAHRGALKGVGSTIAVVGTGLDRVYPAAHKALAHEIAEKGALISSFPLGAQPKATHFPLRNRIVSGLSLGTLVVEAAEKSGSLITARLAMQQGREVFAIPGSIHNPMARGCHKLIKQGAKLVECAQDVLEELAPQLKLPLQAPVAVQAAPVAQLEDEQRALLAHIGFEPISLDELAVLTHWPVSSLQGTLLMLEMAGLIEALPGGLYKRIR